MEERTVNSLQGLCALLSDFIRGLLPFALHYLYLGNVLQGFEAQAIL